MNIVFMGTPEFAVPSLKMLIEKHNVLAVVTQPDRPSGRGKKLSPPMIKTLALEHNIAVLQPESVKEKSFIKELEKLNADIIVVVAFGQILTEEILNMPKFGCINVHGSLLPKYRGAGPIQWAVINGDDSTGVTTMFMAKGLDSGDMLLKETIQIEKDETYGSLHDKMAPIGAKILEETLLQIEKNSLSPVAQNEEEMTIAPMIKKETEHINWNKTSREIDCQIRGLSPKPGAFSYFLEESMKIWKVENFEKKYDGLKCGEVAEIVKKGFVVKTGDTSLLVTEIQAKGGKKMAADAYLRGHGITIGEVLY